MKTRAGHSLRWLSLAVFIPLLLLGTLGWMGTRAQVRAAWASAREEAKVSALAVSASLERELVSAVESAPLFPDPPVPNENVPPEDDILDLTDPIALRALREDPQAGFSASGLPRRVLAGLRLLQYGGDALDKERLKSLAIGEAASVLTPRVLAETGGDSDGAWNRGEKARAAFRHLTEVTPEGRWIDDPAVAWLAPADGAVRFIGRESFSQSLSRAGAMLPEWAALHLSTDGRTTAGDRTDAEVMETVPVDFPGEVRLEIIAVKPELIEAAARQQARWTLALLACAVVVSGGALVLIHRAVERERRLSAMKSDFVASVSHELRAPVASIRLMADALVAGKVDGGTARDFHGLISREGARLSTLIENVLDFARIEQGRKQWHFEDSNLVELVVETVSLMEPLAAEKAIVLTTTLPDAGVDATVDPVAIQQALVNLLDNALKFSPAGSRVAVELAAGDVDSTWELRVTDEGPGIPVAEHQRIFEKFYRIGSELRRETQGTGIGLSLVKAIADAHGGNVRVFSPNEGGSRFIFSAPCSPASATHHDIS